MGFFAMLVMWAITFVVAEVLRPDPDNEKAKPASLGDFQFPTATQGRVVPVLWGTMKIKGPNVVWYGDLRQRAIYHNVKTSMFRTKRVYVGYKYNLGIQFALCRGEVDKLLKVWVGDDLVYDTGLTGPGTITIDKPNLFGGTDKGQGGIVGDLDFVTGNETQAANTYLSDHQKEPPITGDTPAYRGTCYCAWKQGYLGTSTNIKPWSFELQRIPNGLTLASGGAVNTFDANPMNVAYEIMTDTDWGMGIDPLSIDEATMKTAGNTLATEGNGMSLIVDRVTTAGDILAEIQRQADCVFFFDPLTAKWTVQLIRGASDSNWGYNIDTVPQLNDSTIKSVKEFSRTTWEDATNAMRIQFSNREIDYGDDFALAQDQAIFRTKNINIPATSRYIGVKDADLANNIAWRDLRANGATMSKATVVLSRKMWALQPGDPVALELVNLGLNKTAYRVIKIDTGDHIEDEIEVHLVEDLFAFAEPSFSAPGSTGWVPPTDSLVIIPASDLVAFEAPRAFIQRDPEQLGSNRVWVGGINQNNEVEFDVRQRNSSGTPSGLYFAAGVVNDFLLKADVETAINAENGTTSLFIDADESTIADMLAYLTDLDNGDLDNITVGDIGQSLSGLIFVTSDATEDPDATTGEFMAFESYDDLTTRIRLNTCHRGLLDTVPQSFLVGATVYFLIGGLTSTSFAAGNFVDIKLVPISQSDEADEATSVEIDIPLLQREIKPYPPADVNVAALDFPASVNIDTNLGNNDEDGIRFAFNRRDYRVFDEVENIENDAINPDFPAANTTEYQLEIIDDPDGTPVSLFTTPWSAATGSTRGEIDATRTEILRNITTGAKGGDIPSRLRAEISVRHELSGTQTSLQTWQHDFNITASLLGDDFNYGVLDHNVISNVRTITSATAGTHSFTLVASIGGDIEYRINGGTWQTLISSGGTNGTVTPDLVDTDTLEIQHKDTGAGTIMTHLSGTNPDSADAYAILWN